jgi:hypothetical protein
MDLTYAQAVLVDDIRTRMSHLINLVPIRRKAENLRDLTRLFQALAICKLLVDADLGSFRENLTRSGQARRHYLLKSREESNLDDRFLGLSRVQSIFDVVVAGQMELATDLASLSIDEWHPSWEYEDDFCYYLFVHRLILDARFVGGPDAAALVVRLEKVVDGQPSARLRLCQALNARQSTAFRTAFEAFLDEHRSTTDAKRSRITEYTAEAAFWPISFVSIEGLAWLRFAELFGIAPPDHFGFCPAEARDVPGSRTVPDLFESLDAALRET